MKEVEGAIVGAGTVTNPADLEKAMDAGAEFVVSPGLTEPLTKACIDNNMPFLPGTANAGDIMRGMDMGLSHFKFFPAMAAGGLPALKALAAPFGDAKFCPTGGINLANAPDCWIFRVNWNPARSILMHSNLSSRNWNAPACKRAQTACAGWWSRSILAEMKRRWRTA